MSESTPSTKTLGSLLESLPSQQTQQGSDTCPVCSAPVYQEKCKVICRSEYCVYRIIFNCYEF